ncbi:type VI secretion system Vgr family protein [Bartonella sp. HY038]|uniref:type VI secretion system Vgr family protein n=1 Tax=Bartonella sp. HY038 TaxID=2759660 RepID=UPI001AED18EB|nr:type VI secretion system tip protein TssI/VgrG [Bartonella sp. HY038]
MLDQTQDLFFTFESDGIPDGQFVVTSFMVEEAMSSLYYINIQLASRNSTHDLSSLIDKPAVLAIFDRSFKEPRYFHGIVSSAVRGDRGHAFTGYTVTLMPILHRLRFGSDNRIFQQQNVVDIVDTILKEHGIEKVKWQIRKNHIAREYATQYHETHLAFIDRILAEEGISYFFEHEKNEHILVLGDSTLVGNDVKNDQILEYNSLSGGNTYHHYVNQFSWREEVTVSQVRQRDHFFKNPVHNFETSQNTENAKGLQQPLSIYNYPGRYKSDAVGKDFTRYKLEAYRSNASVGSGSGKCQYLSPGFCFSLKEHYDDALNQRYFLVSVSHSGTQPGSLEEYGDGSGTFITTGFHCIPSTTPWRSALFPKPIVEGPQMAIVVGPEGEEIFCDEYGRVKVSFPWDRYSKSNEHSSCWIRIATDWAGGRWGQIAIPRIGQHVIVDFLEGDPDQPIITGRAYNEANRAPNKLPDFKTRMIIQSKTHKGDGFNELRFEDEMDQEEVWLHAEKYLNTVVKDNETWQIGANRHKRVDGSQSESVGGSKDIEVSGSHTEVIAGSMSLKVEGCKKHEVLGDEMSIIHGEQADLIKGNWTKRVERNIRIESEAHQQYKAPGTIFVDGGDKVVIRAGSVISLNVGGNFIRIDDSGIIIEGTVVNVNTGAGSPAKGMEVPMIEPQEADKYQGPYAERYERSYKK